MNQNDRVHIAREVEKKTKEAYKASDECFFPGEKYLKTTSIFWVAPKVLFKLSH